MEREQGNGPLVAWDKLFLPKLAGGLGLRDLIFVELSSQSQNLVVVVKRRNKYLGQNLEE
jgi:hypothetical protein